jgi:ABC-type nitrate/sulfonate/bicarbonate transport system substrate-binding protein
MPQYVNSCAKDETPPTQLWYSRSPVPTVSGVALELKALHNEFARDGISLKNLRQLPSRELSHSDFTHRLPGVFREGGNVPALWARANGANSALLALTWVDEVQAILTRPDSGIRDAGDLAGRRFALPQRTSEQVDAIRAMAFRGAMSALSVAGLPANAIQLVNVPGPDADGPNSVASAAPDEALRALLDGKVDAVYAKGASAAIYTQRYGLRTVVDLGAETQTRFKINNGTPRTITVDRDFATEHPEIVARYLAVLIRVAAWAESHEREVVRIVAGETATDADSVIRGYGPKLHRRLRPQLSAACLSALQLQRNFLYDWDFINSDVDIADWVFPAPLHEALKLAERS